jgi:rRNA maturation protein Nop10
MADIEPCPKCGRADFTSKPGRTLHVKSCKSDGSTIEDPCPHCGRKDFNSMSGRTLHVKNCKAAGKANLPALTAKPKKKAKRNTAKLVDYEKFNCELNAIAEKMENLQVDFRSLAQHAEAVGHDGFEVFCQYFADKRIQMHIDSVRGYANAYTKAAFDQSKKPQPWE